MNCLILGKVERKKEGALLEPLPVPKKACFAIHRLDFTLVVYRRGEILALSGVSLTDLKSMLH